MIGARLVLCGQAHAADDATAICNAVAQARGAGLAPLAAHASPFGPGFRLSPRATGTDGFYIATLTRL